MLHAYCIRRASDPDVDPVPPGVDGHAVRSIAEGPLEIWVSSASGGATVERLRAHERVVRAALRVATPLPLRFGQPLDDEAAARDLLTGRRAEFEAELEWLANRVEMGLSIGVTEAEGQPAAPVPEETAERGRGRAYLEARRAALVATEHTRERAERILDEVEAHFEDLELPTVRIPGTGPEHLGGVAHLVHRYHLRLHHDRVQRLISERRDLRITSTGPWAPYSFVKR